MSNPVPITTDDSLDVFDKMEQGAGGLQYRKDAKPGSVKFVLNEWETVEGEKKSGWDMWFVCPCGCGNCSHIPLNHSGGWNWDGNKEQPTLTPSVQKLVSCSWHGYLTKGVWSPC